MKPEAIETRTLAPTRILEQVLQRNSLEFEICGDVLESEDADGEEKEVSF